MSFLRLTLIVFVCGPLVCWAALPAGAPVFPNLSGRVVDNADMLSASLEAQIKQRLAEHERDTSNQIVVVTLPDLQGNSVESFSYQLARHWGIGQNDRDNGAVLLVAKAERKLRIEVGYGLEGALTDAIAANIIHTIIMPSFKLGKFDEGISNGVDAIIAAIAGEYEAQPEKNNNNDYAPFIIFAFIFFIIIVKSANSGSSGSRRYDDRRYYGSQGGRGYGGGRSGRGGGFSGGGGGFGGGGASGGW